MGDMREFVNEVLDLEGADEDNGDDEGQVRVS